MQGWAVWKKCQYHLSRTETRTTVHCGPGCAQQGRRNGERAMKVSLKVVAPTKWAGKVIPVVGERFLIGRNPACQLRPRSTHIADRHCALLVRAGKAFVRDLDSHGGTALNGRQIKGEI